jgi:hypothetical protein
MTVEATVSTYGCRQDATNGCLPATEKRAHFLPMCEVEVLKATLAK